MRLLSFFSKYKVDILLTLFLLLTTPLFFYKLGQSSLGNWDEAWYAEISRNIVNSGDLINLKWNGASHIEHPPFGFWLTALVFKIFGINDFWARFAQALCGLASIITLYFLGKRLFNRWVGFSSAIALSSAIWFVYRARSGNLDVSLTFLFLTTLLLAILSSSNKKYLIPFSISTSFLLLTKSIVPFTIFPALVLIFYKSKIKLSDLKIPLLIVITIFGGWFAHQAITEPNFLSHYFQTGLPGIKGEINYLGNFLQIKEYLHSGIGKWFWPGLLGIAIGPLFLQKRFFVLTLFFASFFLPFIFSPKGHIWHLIPLFPIIILAFFGFSYTFIEKFIKVRYLAGILILIFSLYISLHQIKMIWYQFIDIPSYISDEAILSKEAFNYPYRLYIDGDFDPVGAFYSQKNVKKYLGGDLINLFDNEKEFLLITNPWRLDQSKIDKSRYQILKMDRDKVLILKN